MIRKTNKKSLSMIRIKFNTNNLWKIMIITKGSQLNYRSFFQIQVSNRKKKKTIVLQELYLYNVCVCQREQQSKEEKEDFRMGHFYREKK